MGPKPGEYAALLQSGLAKARKSILTVPTSDSGLAKVSEPVLTDLGDFPPADSPNAEQFEKDRYRQITDLQFWWLDRMVAANHALTERLTWFWHGHWATALGKVEYALPMYLQNQILRKTALGNFKDQSRQMIVDSALIYWLDGNSNVADSPNENLAREFMELFTLGVGAYSELDVQTIARALTGYDTVRSAGTISFNSENHDGTVLSFLGTSGTFKAPAVSDFITTLSTNQEFIARRLWFRFISSSPLPLNGKLGTAFASREILPLVQSIATNKAMSDPLHSQAKSPVEWFVAICRALNILPSSLTDNSQVIDFLTTLGQVPFDPPNVGGWPTDEAWLNISSMQARLAFSQYLIEQADPKVLTTFQKSKSQIDFLADHLGVAHWSLRTKSALRTSLNDPAEMLIIAVNAPEYVVNG